LCREREGLERSHARAIDAAKAAAADERSAWRAAVTEKIKRQAAEREEQLRALLVAERDAELQEVIRRLQAEQAAALEAAKQQVSGMAFERRFLVLCCSGLSSCSSWFCWTTGRE
jgi:hypothetical protein